MELDRSLEPTSVWDSGICASVSVWSSYPCLLPCKRPEGKSSRFTGLVECSKRGRGRWCLMLQSAVGGEGHQRQEQWQRVESESCLAEHSLGLALQSLAVPKKADHATFFFLIFIPTFSSRLNIAVHPLPVGVGRQPVVRAHCLMSPERGLKGVPECGKGSDL